MLRKTISTKIDSAAAFRKALDAAASEATDAGISARAIADILGSLFKHWDNLAYQAPHVTASPKMYDDRGKPIDLSAKVDAARAARQARIDAACIIPVDQRQVAASGYRK
jgi:hypothetical protein